ncbi:hypothetical protein SDC9_108566 [bioreactor metagenome]|uniref:Uncharacterized protein n=1 Tax=bioreactor metagenome TaxID=1076179 RepID=A0A645B9I8_9ZZZZ
MISISTNSDRVECIRLLQENINLKSKEYLYFIPSVLKKDEIIGNINNNKFWLRKTKPSVYYGLFRVFSGEIITKNGKTHIIGKFQFPWFVKIIDVILLVALVAILIAPGTVYVIPLLMSIIIIMGYHYINILIYKSDEMAVVEFLKELYKDGRQGEDEGTAHPS